MKRHISTFALLLLVPFMSTKADHRDDGDRKHRQTGAPEMGRMGAVSAALIGVAGYLVLRRRHALKN